MLELGAAHQPRVNVISSRARKSGKAEKREKRKREKREKRTWVTAGVNDFLLSSRECLFSRFSQFYAFLAFTPVRLHALLTVMHFTDTGTTSDAFY